MGKMIFTWKRKRLHGIAALFDKGYKSRKNADARTAERYHQAGQLEVENNFLSQIGKADHICICTPSTADRRCETGWLVGSPTTIEAGALGS